MYFISVSGLKTELAKGPMTARRALPYVCTWLGLVTIAANPQVSGNGRPAEWDWLISFYSMFAVVIGVLVAYRANGGTRGVDFVARLLAVWWVVGLRVFLLLIIPLAVLYAIWAPSDASPGAPLLSDLVSTVALTIPVYWRSAVHLKDIRARTEVRPDTSVPGVI